MKRIKLVCFAVSLCVMLVAVPVYGAQQFSIPSGTVVVGQGSGNSSEYLLTASPAKSQGVLRLDPAGMVGPDVAIEAYVKLSPPAFGDAGFVYRTSNWGTTNDTFGWYVGIMKSGVLIGYGTNSSVSAWHRVSAATMPITQGVWYKLKVIVSGDNHKVFLNDSLVIEVNHPQFNDIAGYAGLRVFKLSAAYKNVTIQ